MPTPITVQVHTRDHGATTMELIPVWRGRSLAVHPPVTGDGIVVARGVWTITHHPSGLGAAVRLPISKQNAIALARAWDDRFCELNEPADARGWPHREAFCAEVARLKSPWQSIARVPSEENLWTSLSLAIGRRLSVRSGDSPSIRWRGQWWDAPTDADLDAWTLDSCCETPDGRTVEPDAPDSWLRILGLV